MLTLLRFRVKAVAFQSFFEENPDSLLRMVQVRTVLCGFHECISPVQIIMVRLQRVTFLALNQFLGLGRELLNQVCAMKPCPAKYKIICMFVCIYRNQI